MKSEHLSELEEKSIYIIREAYQRFDKPAVLWSIGKDSTTLLYLIKKSFFGEIPFPVIHIDTSYKFKEIYEFREMLSSKLGFDVIIGKNKNVLPARPDDVFECCNHLKTDALKQTIYEYGFNALFLGIRRDEHGVRAKERYISPRTTDSRWDVWEQPTEFWDIYSAEISDKEHVRVHPLLGWNEIDIWRYIKQEDIPVVNLYFAKNGKRYRSIGCEPCCEPMDSSASSLEMIIDELSKTNTSERAGRSQDKEGGYMMEKLRALGYM